jgi:hypothetical protein
MAGVETINWQVARVRDCPEASGESPQRVPIVIGTSEPRNFGGNGKPDPFWGNAQKNIKIIINQSTNSFKKN